MMNTLILRKLQFIYGFNLVNRSISNHFPNNYHLVAWDRLWGVYFEFLQCLLLPLLQIPTDVPCRGLVRPVEGKFGIIIHLYQKHFISKMLFNHNLSYYMLRNRIRIFLGFQHQEKKCVTDWTVLISIRKMFFRHHQTVMTLLVCSRANFTVIVDKLTYMNLKSIRKLILIVKEE